MDTLMIFLGGFGCGGFKTQAGKITTVITGFKLAKSGQ